MSRLEIFVSKNRKNQNFSVAIGRVKIKNKTIEKIVIKDDAKNAVFSLVKKFQSEKIKFSEIILNGTENYFLGTPLESYVIILKNPENFFPDFLELKKVALHEKKKILSNKNRCQLVKSDTNISKKTKDSDAQTTKQLGDRAESVVTNFLEENGHEIIARNYKTKFYEIDIVSTKADNIYFTEVKYRKSDIHGASLEAITPRKIKQMTFAARAFLKSHPDLKTKYSPLLAAASVSGASFNLDDWFPLK